MDIFYISFELGLLYSLVVFGIFLTFRILKFPDLTVDGSFVTGAAVAALALKSGIPAVPALILAFLSGFGAGSITAFLHIKIGIGRILSSIIALSMLYTINLRLMGGPNISLLNQPNVLWWLKASVNHLQVIGILLTIVILIKLALDWFLSTEIGLFIRATGENEDIVRSFGVNPSLTKFLGIGLANALVGLGGGLIAQNQGFVDINMGVGVITIGVASYMLGEVFMKTDKFYYLTAAVIFGSLLYQLIISVCLQLGLAGMDLKFFTAFIIVVLLLLKLKWGKDFYGATVSRY
jgi:putative ABC transport system permease protein